MNSIQNEISGETLANQIRMERATHSGSFLIVEGYTDAKLFRKFTEKDICSIIICIGRERLYKVLEILSEEGFSGAVGFADKDYSDLFGAPYLGENIVHTDDNDLEITMLCSPALLYILMEYGSEDKIAAETMTSGQAVTDLIFASASSVGALRVLSEENGWALKFKDMSIKFATNANFNIDLKRTTTNVVAITRSDVGVSVDEICGLVASKLEATSSIITLCNGHDCIRVLGKAFSGKLGSANQFDSDKKIMDLEKVLRLAYEYSFFQSTASYAAIRDWENRSGYTVLR